MRIAEGPKHTWLSFRYCIVYIDYWDVSQNTFRRAKVPDFVIDFIILRNISYFILRKNNWYFTKTEIVPRNALRYSRHFFKLDCSGLRSHKKIFFNRIYREKQ